ncbi:MAG: hypothetical protein AAF413_03685 [Patescibacteria group bacterium]
MRRLTSFFIGDSEPRYATHVTTTSGDYIDLRGYAARVGASALGEHAIMGGLMVDPVSYEQVWGAVEYAMETVGRFRYKRRASLQAAANLIGDLLDSPDIRDTGSEADQLIAG